MPPSQDDGDGMFFVAFIGIGLVSLAVLGVVIWAIVRLVLHFT